MRNEEPDLRKSPRRKETSPNIDRLPPHSMEAEQAAIGCGVMDPQNCMPQLIEAFPSPDVFYDLRHQTIYKTMVELWEDNDPIDVISLQDRLKVWELLEQVGGLGYITSLPDLVPSVLNLPYYIGIVRDNYFKRRLIKIATDTVGILYDAEGKNTEEILDQCESALLKASEERVAEATSDIKSLVTQALNDIDDFQKRGGEPIGIATGFRDLDRLTSGLQNGEMIVIAARPSVGKTSLAMNIAETVACDRKLPVGVFSLEMTARSLVRRMICSRARVSLRNVQEGFLAERDVPKLSSAASNINSAPLYIDDSGGLSILQLRAKARRMWQRYKIKLLVIDYLQLLHSTNKKAESRQQEVADISTGIKNIAKELNIPVIVLSQLNRDIEKDKNRPPRLSDLRESGAIEQDADLVGFLYRPKRDGEDEDDYNQPSDSEYINLLISKQRNGPAGRDVPLTFFKAWTRFESAALVSTEDPEPEQREFIPAENGDQ